MIREYHRPKNIDEALRLITQPVTFPLGGGTWLNQPRDVEFSVVDLQALGLNKIFKSTDNLEIGAATTLQRLFDSAPISPSLKEVIKLETSYNLRQMATVAGTLVTCTGRSPFATAMLALDAKITLLPGNQELPLGDLLPLMRLDMESECCSTVHPKLITKIKIPVNVVLAFECIARTPTDQPIVCAALVTWSSGRARLALGGYGISPVLALDGNEPGGLEAAARVAYADAADEWASSEYRAEMAAVLAKRCLEKSFPSNL